MADIFEENTEANEWMKFGMRIAISTTLHPIEYGKVLIQLGFEPIAPRPGHTFLGQKALILPNILQYVKHIRKVDGFFGLYRGLTPKLIGIVIGSIGSEKIATKLGLEQQIESPAKDEVLSSEEEYRLFETQLKRDLVLHVSGIIISQPFHVISVRMMAQFIGHETTYNSLWSSIKEIWNTEGISGFFAGVTPKILFDTSILILASTTTYLVSKHYIRERANQPYFGSVTQFIFSTIMYPLNVVGICMAVSGSKLAAGNPPYMSVYRNWRECYNDLSLQGELKRGSSLFFRYQKPLIGSFKSMPSVPFPAIGRKAIM